MIINWVATKAQHLIPEQDAGADELRVDFDFALSAEIMDLLYAQNMEGQQVDAVNATAIPRFALDEHELALA